jgi:hypothetical protein
MDKKCRWWQIILAVAEGRPLLEAVAPQTVVEALDIMVAEADGTTGVVAGAVEVGRGEDGRESTLVWGPLY